jgi:hypothetical protein
MKIIDISKIRAEPFMKHVSQKDAKLLINWWNANSDYYYYFRSNTHGLTNIIRQKKS